MSIIANIRAIDMRRGGRGELSVHGRSEVMWLTWISLVRYYLIAGSLFRFNQGSS